jgi:protein involved in polysaccharide export with SLBB domain
VSSSSALPVALGRGCSRRLVLGLLGLTLLGCGPRRAPRPVNLPPPSDKTTIGPGDVFFLQIVGEKELPQEFQVASDGSADLPYVHRLEVAGLEPQEIARVVRQLLIDKKILSDPVVIVQVREYRSRSVILLGQVVKPGSFPLTPGLTLLQAVSLAGGLTPIADGDKVTLTRRVGKGTMTVRVSVDAITEGDLQDIPLQAGDRVYVSERLF